MVAAVPRYCIAIVASGAGLEASIWMGVATTATTHSLRSSKNSGPDYFCDPVFYLLSLIRARIGQWFQPATGKDFPELIQQSLVQQPIRSYRLAAV